MTDALPPSQETNTNDPEDTAPDNPTEQEEQPPAPPLNLMELALAILFLVVLPVGLGLGLGYRWGGLDGMFYGGGGVTIGGVLLFAMIDDIGMGLFMAGLCFLIGLIGHFVIPLFSNAKGFWLHMCQSNLAVLTLLLTILLFSAIREREKTRQKQQKDLETEQQKAYLGPLAPIAFQRELITLLAPPHAGQSTVLTLLWEALGDPDQPPEEINLPTPGQSTKTGAILRSFPTSIGQRQITLCTLLQPQRTELLNYLLARSRGAICLLMWADPAQPTQPAPPTLWDKQERWFRQHDALSHLKTSPGDQCFSILTLEPDAITPRQDRLQQLKQWLPNASPDQWTRATLPQPGSVVTPVLSLITRIQQKQRALQQNQLQQQQQQYEDSLFS